MEKNSSLPLYLCLVAVVTLVVMLLSSCNGSGLENKSEPAALPGATEAPAEPTVEPDIPEPTKALVTQEATAESVIPEPTQKSSSLSYKVRVKGLPEYMPLCLVAGRKELLVIKFLLKSSWFPDEAQFQRRFFRVEEQTPRENTLLVSWQNGSTWVSVRLAPNDYLQVPIKAFLPYGNTGVTITNDISDLAILRYTGSQNGIHCFLLVQPGIE